MRSILVLAAALASIVVVAGCDKARPLPAPADPSGGCVSCHGGQESSTGAPPWSLPRNAAGEVVASGNRFDATASTTQVEVGAHTGHLSRGVSCGACHVVPTMISSPGHGTGTRATVTFKEAAAAGNVTPSAWNPAIHTCSNYCHGSSLNAGGSLTTHAPDWLKPADGACGTCHFADQVTPPATHPQGPASGGAFANTVACATCHGETVNAADGTVNVAGGKHVNGVLDVVAGGGHPAGWVNPASHGPAATGGLQNCAVCHGADFGGAGNPAMDCNACHASAGHPFWQSECTFCHGSAPRAADTGFPLVPTPLPAGAGTSLQVRANLASPPLGSQGENAITAYAVGAHQAHVSPTRFASAMLCRECHGPSLPADTAHVGGTVLLGWGPVASAGGSPLAPPAGETNRWNDATLVPGGATCTNYCHGATIDGGARSSPKWNTGPGGLACGSCHGLPPTTAAHPSPVTECGSCHPGYSAGMPTSASTIAAVNVLSHLNGQLDGGGGDCTGCHATAQGTRRAIVPEFALAWSHKRSAGGAVTKWDCVVCHMEGDAATGGTSAVHRDGVINLRDPDTGANIKGVTFGGAGAGAYSSTATDATFTRFSRDLGSNVLEASTVAIMINQCLKCHDADGAVSASARVPTTGTAAKPFGTTIAGAAYVGAGVTAGGVAGGVADVNASFAPTNSSYHPVTGRQNNWYAKLTRMVAPWNAATRGATVDVTSWGPLLSCWDCHAPPAATGVQTFTVTAHGAAAANYLRGTVTVSGTPSAANQVTLCARCHAGYLGGTTSTHGAGSALSSTTNGGMTPYLNFGCNACHSSGFSTAVVRPVRAQDTHGVNALPAGAGTTSDRWSTDTRPYAFIRNLQQLANHAPLRVGATTYTPGCNMRTNPCNQGPEVYTAGGTF